MEENIANDKNWKALIKPSKIDTSSLNSTLDIFMSPSKSFILLFTWDLKPLSTETEIISAKQPIVIPRVDTSPVSFPVPLLELRNLFAIKKKRIILVQVILLAVALW